MNTIKDDQVTVKTRVNKRRIMPEGITVAHSDTLLEEITSAHVFVQIDGMHVIFKNSGKLLDKLGFARS